MFRAAVEGITIGSIVLALVVLTPLPLWGGVVIVVTIAAIIGASE